MKARQRINDEQKDRKIGRETIEEVGKSSTGVLTKSGNHTLGETVFHFVIIHVKAKADKEREALTREKSNHAEKRSKAAAVLLAKGSDHTKWCVTDLKDVLGAVKTKDNRSLPTLKADLLTLYIKWKGRIARI